VHLLTDFTCLHLPTSTASRFTPQVRGVQTRWTPRTPIKAQRRGGGPQRSRAAHHIGTPHDTHTHDAQRHTPRKRRHTAVADARGLTPPCSNHLPHVQNNTSPPPTSTPPHAQDNTSPPPDSTPPQMASVDVTSRRPLSQNPRPRQSAQLKVASTPACAGGCAHGTALVVRAVIATAARSS